MTTFTQERHGIGRREDDHTCMNHEQNTKDITAMKANMRLLMWIIPLALGIASMITGYTVKSMNDNMAVMAGSVQRIESDVQKMALSVERSNVKWEYFERESSK